MTLSDLIKHLKSLPGQDEEVLWQVIQEDHLYRPGLDWDQFVHDCENVFAEEISDIAKGILDDYTPDEDELAA